MKIPMLRRLTASSKRTAGCAGLSALLLGAVAGCGRVAPDGDTGKVLLTVTGEVTNVAEVKAQPGQVRMALVWSSAPKDDNGTLTFNTSQDIAMTTQFPASFSFEISALPPQAMMIGKNDLDQKDQSDLPDGFSFAVGGLVVYEDSNGNGQLDLVGENEAAVDKILGADDELNVFYFEGTLPPPILPPDQIDGSWQLGYNLVKIPGCVLDDRLGEQPSQPCAKAEIYQPDAQGVVAGIQLPLTTDPRLARWMCKGDFGDSIGVGVVPAPMGPAQAPFPKADDPNLICTDGGKGYLIQSCVEETSGPCTGTLTTCTSQSWTMPDPSAPPADWPCALGGGSGGSSPVPVPTE